MVLDRSRREMLRCFGLAVCGLMMGSGMSATSSAQQAKSPLPRIEQKEGRFALMVDGAPYLMLGAQVNNSSAWSSMMTKVWPTVERIGINTLEVPIYWEQFEPEKGKFDPSMLHTLLEQARAGCDRLVVGVNSDASVARLKGAGRPVQSEASRAAVLASLGVVDLVVVFDEDTPEALIRALRPDLLVKGADYRMEGVVGADLVRGWGGRVLLAELLPGHSTTETVARIRG